MSRGQNWDLDPGGQIPQPMFLATEPNSQALYNLWP